MPKLSYENLEYHKSVVDTDIKAHNVMLAASLPEDVMDAYEGKITERDGQEFRVIDNMIEDYLFVAMKSYQIDGKGPIGRSNPIMAAQAKMFTLPELKLLSHYIAGLPSDLKTVPQAKFR